MTENTRPDPFNISLRKFLKQLGVTSQREIERVVRDGHVDGTTLRLRMTLTSPGAPLEHVVETTIELLPPSTPESAAMF